jgi:hypothetical protein
MNERPRIIICQGPPRCDYDDAKPDRELPCPWCKIEIQDRNGFWQTASEPANA